MLKESTIHSNVSPIFIRQIANLVFKMCCHIFSQKSHLNITSWEALAKKEIKIYSPRLSILMLAFILNHNSIFNITHILFTQSTENQRPPLSLETQNRYTRNNNNKKNLFTTHHIVKTFTPNVRIVKLIRSVCFLCCCNDFFIFIFFRKLLCTILARAQLIARQTFSQL